MTVCEKNDIIFKKLTLSILCAGKLKNNALQMNEFTMATVFCYFSGYIRLTLIRSMSLGRFIFSLNIRICYGKYSA